MSNSSLKSTRGRRNKVHGFAARGGVLLVALLLTLMALACYNTRTGRVDVGGEINFKLPAFMQTGSHAVEVFTEMHFQPSYRTQEGPRLLPPEDSVPITGREIEYKSVEEYQALAIPADIDGDPQALSRARHTYDTNCLVCHGSNLRGENGNAPILGYLDESDLRPRDLVEGDADTLNATNATDGEIYAWITYGGQAGFALALRDRPTSSWMPPFGRLLTEQERWELVKFIKAEQGR